MAQHRKRSPCWVAGALTVMALVAACSDSKKAKVDAQPPIVAEPNPRAPMSPVGAAAATTPSEPAVQPQGQDPTPEATLEQRRLETAAAAKQRRLDDAAARRQRRLDDAAALEQGRLDDAAAAKQRRAEDAAAAEERRKGVGRAE